MYSGAITDVDGLRAGHAHDMDARTGVTVVYAAGGFACGVDVRGAAPGTRETDLLKPGNTVERVNAICLCGGSAYGLDAAGGVMRRLEGMGEGFRTAAGVVPIVCAAVIYDLGVGDGRVRPDAAMGAAALDDACGACIVEGSAGAMGGSAACGGCAAQACADAGAGTGASAGSAAVGVCAAEGSVDAAMGNAAGCMCAEGYSGAGTGSAACGTCAAQGRVGAGAGATVGKAAGGAPADGGVGMASVTLESGVVVAALVVVNAVGDIYDGERCVASGTIDGRPVRVADVWRGGAPGENTTIGVIATDAALDKAQLCRLASVGHDGMALAVRPAHTVMDGDTLFALSCGDKRADLFALHMAAVEAVRRAIVNAVSASA